MVMRLGAWAWLVALPACQLVAGITDVSSNGPCTDDRECPRTESCVDGHCRTKSTSGGAGSGAQGGTAGTSGEAGAGQTNMGGSSGLGGSSASGGASGTSQAGATVAQGGDDGAGVSGDGGSVSGDSGGGGDGETSGAAGSGGVAGAGAGNGGAGGAGAGGAAGMTAGSSGTSGMAGTAGAGPVRIMPLGDGITATTCMRAFLWELLRDNAYPEFDFVGSRLSADTCSPSDYDKDNEGHSGYRVSDLLAETSQHTSSDGDPYTGSSADLNLWFDGRPADIVLMLFGSNDFLSTNQSAANVQNAYSAILTKLRSVNPRVTLLVGLLPPMRESPCDSSCQSRLSDLNDAIPEWADSMDRADSHVDHVDLSGMSIEDTTADGVKPNDTGAQFLAQKWYDALMAL
jgi:acyl-CoA thioesterase-1